MPPKAVSRHLLRVFQFFESTDGRWASAADVAEAADVAHRTARGHCKSLLDAGLLESVEMFPSNLYRLGKVAAKKNPELVRKLRDAASATGAEK